MPKEEIIDFTEHVCHAVGCDTPCHPRYLMCADHWKMVPQTIQACVYFEYTTGQCNGRVMPTKAYFDAARSAIMFVRKREGK